MLLGMLLFTLSLLYGQKPVALQAIELFSGNTPTVYTPFMEGTPAKESTFDLLRQGYSMQLKPEVFSQIKQKAPSIFRLHLDDPFHLELDLYRVNIYSPSSRILTSDGRSADPNPNHFFYRGIIHGKVNSLVTVSILDDHMIILYADESGNHRIQPSPIGGYIAFADHDVLVPPQIECHADDADAGITTQTNSSNNRTTGNCIEVYIEADYKSYQDNGSSVSATEAWVAGLWNEVITLYENEDIPVSLSDIKVYTSTDPFAGINTTLAVLYAFSAHIDTITYDGRLAHFMSTRNLGGGIAWINVLCSTSSPCAVSTTLSTTIVGFPTYSWNVMELTHEMGHNLGSRHTHACVWNGNNTQIDDCGNQWAINNNQNPEGAACFDPNNPILPDAGTIMSYCHAIGGVGIDFNLGFGPLPGNLIRSTYNNANCNTGICSVPSCTNLSTPLDGAINVESCDNLSWIGIVGVSGYKLTIGTTPNGGEIVNNLNVGMATTYNPVSDLPFNAIIYVKIVPFNDAGDAVGCINEIFTVEPNIQPLCTSLTNPPPGDLNCPLTAVMRWAHSIGNQTGYKITMGTTPTGTDIANNVDVGNETAFDPPGFLPPGSTIYVKITPYGNNGDTPNCIVQNFTTAPPIDGDFCNIAINLNCGVSITGSTLNAYFDSDAITCGVTVQAPGIWYKFVGDGQNTIISLCSQYGYDTQLNAYSGSCTSLTCVAGNDDFCSVGSRLTFPTTNGTTYYILVQGWNGQIGNYTITRSCYGGPFYCQSGGRTANLEWIKTFSVAGYQKQSGSSHYSDYTGETITLSRGGVYTATITPAFNQGVKNEYLKIWIDLNRDGDFTDNFEEVSSAGPFQSAVSASLTVPVNINTGNTRMRVSMEREGFPTSCELLAYGEVEDYNVSIRCNLVNTTADDNSNGSLRSVSFCADDNESILFAPTLNDGTINITQGPITCDGQWKWMADAGTNIKIKAAANVQRVLTVPVQRSVEIQNLEIIGGIASFGSAIDNLGVLTLRNVKLTRAVGTTTIPLQNKGSTFIQGTSYLKI